MAKIKKFPEPVEVLILILSAFVVNLLISGLLSEIDLQGLLGISELETIRIFYILGSIVFFIIPFIYIRYMKYEINILFRLKPVSQEIVLYSLLIGVTIGIVGDELDRLVSVILPMPQFLIDLISKVMIAQSVFDWFFLFLGVVIIASVVEEILFRGLLQVTLESKGDITRAVLLASISWTLIHLNPFWAVQIFVMGIILGFLAWKTGSVIPSIIAHGLNNLMSLLFINMNLETDMEWYLTGDHVNPMILLPSIAIIIWSIRQITSIYSRDAA